MKYYEKPTMAIFNLTSQERIGNCIKVDTQETGPIGGSPECESIAYLEDFS